MIDQLELPAKRNQRTCQQCGKDYYVYRSNQRFCSDICRYKSARKTKDIQLRELESENRRLKREAEER
jgi:hypothetical protein